MAGDVYKRLRALESRVQPGTYPESCWPEDDQLEEILDHVQVNRWGRTAYPATDRELNILAGFYAYRELKGGVGELELPSGAIVALEDAGDGYRDMAVSGAVLPSDLPEGIQEYVERMDPEKQPDRELWLYEHRHTNKVEREAAQERIANRKERERAFREESMRRDRELLERNRAAAGAPPLFAEELTKWGYEITPIGGGGAT